MHEIKRLAKFLKVKAADDLALCKAIQEKTSFKSFKAEKVHKPEVTKVVFKGEFNIIRKGLLTVTFSFSLEFTAVLYNLQNNF